VIFTDSDICVIAVAIGLVMRFIHGDGAAGTGIFRSALARQMAGAGLPARHADSQNASLAT
jgi:hypothetical protein